jgi:hypothetical protein
MAFTFNPFTGNLDIYGDSTGSGGPFVPYTGATGDVTLGSYTLRAAGIGIGIAPDASTGVYVSGNYNASNYCYGVNLKNYNTYTPTGTETNSALGVYVQSRMAGVSNTSGNVILYGTLNNPIWTGNITAAGAGSILFGFSNSPSYTGAGTLPQITGILTSITINNAAAVVTNAYGQRISDITLTAGAVTNQYQLYIASPTKGSTKWGIYSLGGNNSFAGNTYIGANTVPTAKLHLAAGTATAGTAPLKFTAGTNTTVAVAGQVEYTTGAFHIRSDRFLLGGATDNGTAALQVLGDTKLDLGGGVFSYKFTTTSETTGFGGDAAVLTTNGGGLLLEQGVFCWDGASSPAFLYFTNRDATIQNWITGSPDGGTSACSTSLYYQSTSGAHFFTTNDEPSTGGRVIIGTKTDDTTSALQANGDIKSTTAIKVQDASGGYPLNYFVAQLSGGYAPAMEFWTDDGAGGSARRLSYAYDAMALGGIFHSDALAGGVQLLDPSNGWGLTEGVHFGAFGAAGALVVPYNGGAWGQVLIGNPPSPDSTSALQVNGAIVATGTATGSTVNDGNARFIMSVDYNYNPSIELHAGKTGFNKGFAAYIDFALTDDADNDGRIIVGDGITIPAEMAFQSVTGFTFDHPVIINDTFANHNGSSYLQVNGQSYFTDGAGRSIDFFNPGFTDLFFITDTTGVLSFMNAYCIQAYYTGGLNGKTGLANFYDGTNTIDICNSSGGINGTAAGKSFYLLNGGDTASFNDAYGNSVAIANGGQGIYASNSSSTTNTVFIMDGTSYAINATGPSHFRRADDIVLVNMIGSDGSALNWEVTGWWGGTLSGSGGALYAHDSTRSIYLCDGLNAITATGSATISGSVLIAETTPFNNATMFEVSGTGGFVNGNYWGYFAEGSTYAAFFGMGSYPTANSAAVYMCTTSPQISAVAAYKNSGDVAGYFADYEGSVSTWLKVLGQTWAIETNGAVHIGVTGVSLHDIMTNSGNSAILISTTSGPSSNFHVFDYTLNDYIGYDVSYPTAVTGYAIRATGKSYFCSASSTPVTEATLISEPGTSHGFAVEGKVLDASPNYYFTGRLGYGDDDYNGTSTYTFNAGWFSGYDDGSGNIDRVYLGWLNNSTGEHYSIKATGTNIFSAVTLGSGSTPDSIVKTCTIENTNIFYGDPPADQTFGVYVTTDLGVPSGGNGVVAGMFRSDEITAALASHTDQFAGYFNNGSVGDSVYLAYYDGVTDYAIHSTGNVLMSALQSGSGPPATINTTGVLYCDTLTGILYVQ